MAKNQRAKIKSKQQNGIKENKNKQSNAKKQTKTSNQRAVQCDSCDVWYHVKCMQMSTHVYEALANSSCIWECVVCGLPNFSSSLFESSTTKVTNYFWPLDTDLSDKSHNESIYTVNQSTQSTQAMSIPTGSPLHTSSPSQRKPTYSSKLRILTVNCNSLQSKSKQNQLIDLIESHNPDIICGQESKLDESMKTNEIFPPPFQDQVSPKDFKAGERDVFVAGKNDILASQIDNLTQCGGKLR